MNKQKGFIQFLLVIVLAAAAIFTFMYFWQKYSLGNSFSSTPTNSGNSGSGSINPLLGFGGNFSTPSSGGGSTKASVKNSPYAGSIMLDSGSAESSYQPEGEYVEIYNRGGSPVDITGWTLENAYGNRPLQTTGNQAVNVVPEQVKIPEGTNFLDPSDSFVLSPIVLQPSDTAIVTTGAAFVSYPYKISVSFRVNECAGYFNYNYPFDPQINNDCPSPQNEPGVNAITDVCYTYVKNLPTCYDPAVRDTANLRNNFQQNCVNYIDDHFNYGACVANHENDANFNQPTWRVFLGLNHELWHEPDDSIKLFDGSGKLVDEIDY